jgi:nucleoside 2-deoxyribosyltransferase
MAGGRPLEDILAAAKRVADKSFVATKEKARRQLVQSNGRGGLGSSSHMLAEEKIFIEGYEDLCGGVISRVADLATDQVDVYEQPVISLLGQYWTPMFNEFLNYAAPGADGILRNTAARIAQDLDAKFQAITNDTMSEFRLRFLPDGAPRSVAGLVNSNPGQVQQLATGVGYPATVLKVMIASPGDVTAERDVVREVIHEWNAVHSEDKGIVLLPVGWESHSSPEMGARPQEIINRQLLRQCDMLVAAFWTRVGTPTGKADSGTAEEIMEFISAGKPALLYFSSQPIRPDSVDPSQYNALKAFKAQKLAEGLVVDYDSIDEFRTKLRRHMAQTIIREFRPVSSRSAPPSLADNHSRQMELADRIKEAFQDGGNVKISFASMGEQRLAKALLAVFDLAGWKTQFTNTPLERQAAEYIGGIEVWGHNEAFVERLCKVLGEDGLEVRPKVTATDVPHDNPKWPMAQRYARITVGRAN